MIESIVAPVLFSACALVLVDFFHDIGTQRHLRVSSVESFR